MACSEPICYLLHWEAADGAESLLMEPDLASALTDAVSDPARLSAMASAGQRHILDSYSWDRAAEKIVFI